MDWMTTKEASEKWGLTMRRIQILCERKQIDNVVRMGNMWLIPKAAEKPLDGRTKEAKIKKRGQNTGRIT
jgi:hypothetical protein